VDSEREKGRGGRGGEVNARERVNSKLTDELRFAGLDRATLTNTTLQETDSRIVYTGTWDNNTNPLFSGGGTTYTNTDSSFSFEFRGSSRSLPKAGAPCIDS